MESTLEEILLSILYTRGPRKQLNNKAAEILKNRYKSVVNAREKLNKF